ncbi:MAG: DUF1549 domain-containing protein, partial [Verrucomicrobiales bacterium]|nr:DUF1549 domain-containing protein [Verrucomicrobiales bacterium]
MKALWLSLTIAWVVAGTRARATGASDLFSERVRPLLELRCVNCHGPEKQKGNLRLDSREAALRGGDLGPSIVPGNPAASLLVQAVSHAQPDLAMPPKEQLRGEEVRFLEEWIRAGAPWPSPAPADKPADSPASNERIGDAWSDPRNPITRIFQGQRLDLWSFRPLTRPAVPPIVAAPLLSPPIPDSPHPIDRFIRTRLASQQLGTSPAADRRTLARRLHLDLTGIPPSAEDMDRFLNDSRPDAFERLIDRLLASPRYGEHQARLWLDVVRYSDSNGFDWDEFRPQAWRFRDYVIRSFNADKPFAQFVREQLAGDEMLAGPPRSEAE